MESPETKPEFNSVPPQNYSPQKNYGVRYFVVILVLVIIAVVVWLVVKEKPVTTPATSTQTLSDQKNVDKNGIATSSSPSIAEKVSNFPVDLPSDALQAAANSPTSADKAVLSFTSKQKIADEYALYKQFYSEKGWTVSDLPADGVVQTLRAVDAQNNHVLYISFVPTATNQTNISINYIQQAK